MRATPGHDPGQHPEGFTWAEYLAWLVARHGALSAVAEQLCARRAWSDDRDSVERALRRLRTRGDRDGGLWGQRCLAAFGLPDAVAWRARWFGTYHSRFTDLPVGLCEDLLRLWDRPPVRDDPGAHCWLALAHASCALRSARPLEVGPHLQRARSVAKVAPPAARVELLLVEAFVASRAEPQRVDGLLDAVPVLLPDVDDAGERQSLRARWVDQVAWQWNKGRRTGREEPATAEALYRALDDDGAPPFARCRRASGLAWCRWRQGFADEGAAFARAAVDHAGDGGHTRLRAMSLQMLARMSPEPDATSLRARALAIATSLDDEALRLRFTRGV